MQTLKAKVEIKSLDKKISIKRILGNFDGSKNGPTVIFFGGIHGNEKAGIHALINVIQKIEDEGIIIDGNFYAVSGNLNALKNNIRFITPYGNIDIEHFKDTPIHRANIIYLVKQKYFNILEYQFCFL